MLRRFLSSLLLGLALLAHPARAAVVMTFWSHDQDKDFPHAFFALKGTPDAGGTAVDANYGFTAKAITPAILLGNVAGEVEASKPGYLRRSDARFAVTLTDAQYAAVQALIATWSHDTRYNLNKRNCVHFVAEAARLADLAVPDLPKLMKKPRSFLLAVADANGGRITRLDLDGQAYLATYGDPAAAAPAAPGAAVADDPVPAAATPR